MESKRDIRKRVLKERKLIPEQEWEEKSHQISEKVTTHPFFLKADTIFCYVDYQSEVGTREIIQKAWSLGKKVAVPRVIELDLQFYEIQNFSELHNGYHEILEPVTEKLIEPEEGLVILPGVAFDKERNRIGYGKGFYDRFLNKHLSLNSLAVCFEQQIVDSIPSEPNDIKPEILITEEQTYV